MRRPHFKNEEGKQFGFLRVIKEADPIWKIWKGSNRTCKIIRWLCECKCGNRVIVRGANLRQGDIVSCGCYRKSLQRKLMGAYWKDKKPYAVEYRYYRDYRKEAIKKNMKFDLSLEEFMKIIYKNCHYCNCKPSLKRYNKGKGRMKLVNGIDRLDNSKGYIEGNMVTCCKQCNFSKGQMSVTEYVKFIKRVYDFQYNFGGLELSKIEHSYN